VLILANNLRWLWNFVILGILAISIPFLYDDSAMTVSTLSVINPLFENLPTPFKVVQRVYDPFILQSILHSLFFGAGILMIWQLLHEDKA
jgi:hypothetical protein